MESYENTAGDWNWYSELLKSKWNGSLKATDAIKLCSLFKDMAHKLNHSQREVEG